MRQAVPLLLAAGWTSSPLLLGLLPVLGALIAASAVWATVQPTLRKLRAEADKAAAETTKAEADAAEVISRASLGLLEPLERRLAQLTSEADGLRGRVAELTSEVASLTSDVQSLTDRLELAHRALDAHDIPFPPTPTPAVTVRPLSPTRRSPRASRHE